MKMKDKKKIKIGLALVDNKTIKIFNKKYLSRDIDTDVISFDVKEDTPDGYYFLGDVIISADQVKKQAGKYAATDAEEIARVVAHGVLHLLGYDDEKNMEKKEMTKIEDKVLDGIFSSRKLIKGVDYIGVSVGAVIINDQGEIFLSLRGKEVRNESGKWEFPGGGVDFNETLSDAIVREVKEEFGFDVEVMEILHVSNHMIPDEKQHWVPTTFMCRVAKGTPRIMEPKKCDKVGWFSLEKISKMNLSIISQIDLEMIKRRFSKDLPNYYN